MQLADQRFTGLLEAAPDAMVCADDDGRIILVNAQAERLFGYPGRARRPAGGDPGPRRARPNHPEHRAGYDG